MLVETIKDGLVVHEFIGVAVSILNKLILYALIDEVKECRLLNHSKLAVRDDRDSPRDPSVLFSEGVAVYFLDHVDKLLAVLHLDIAEEMAEKVDNREETSVDLVFLLLSWVGLDPVHLVVLSHADQLLELLVTVLKSQFGLLLIRVLVCLLGHWL